MGFYLLFDILHASTCASTSVSCDGRGRCATTCRHRAQLDSVDVRQHVRTIGLLGLMREGMTREGMMREGMTREGMTREGACTSSAPLARVIARGPRLPPAFIGLS